MKYLTSFILIFSLLSCSNKNDEIIDEGTKQIEIVLNSINEIGANQVHGYGTIENYKKISTKKLGFCWSTKPNPTILDNQIETSLINEKFDIIINSLEQNSNYYIRAFATIDGETFYSNEINFTTNSIKIVKETTFKFNSNYEERVESAIKTSDGGFLVTGYVKGFFNLEADAIILKYNSNCELQWKTILTNPNTSQFPQDIIQDSDGNILISSLFFNSNGLKSSLTKLDQSGNLLWEKIVDENTSNSEEKYGNESLIQASDGNYIMTGNWNPDFNSTQYPDSNFSIIKVSRKGELIFKKNYGYQNNIEHSWDLIENKNGDLMLIGTAKGQNVSSDLKLIKLNAEGIFQWDKLIGDSNNEYPRSVISSSDGNLIISGWTNSSSIGHYDIWVTKIDWKGNIIWKNSIGEKNKAIEIDGSTSIIESSDNNIYIAATISDEHCSNCPPLETDVFIAKLNSNGNKLWTKTISSVETKSFDGAKSVIELNNGEIILAGYKEDESYPILDGTRGDIWILKITKN
jgi:hypothetical protein